MKASFVSLYNCRHCYKEKTTKKTPSLFMPFVKFLGLTYVSNVIYMFLKVRPVYLITCSIVYCVTNLFVLYVRYHPFAATKIISVHVTLCGYQGKALSFFVVILGKMTVRVVNSPVVNLVTVLCKCMVIANNNIYSSLRFPQCFTQL